MSLPLCLRAGAQPLGRVLVLVLLLVGPAWAQGPADGGPEPGSQPATAVPIDGGASALLAAGAAYGLRRLRRRARR